MGYSSNRPPWPTIAGAKKQHSHRLIDGHGFPPSPKLALIATPAVDGERGCASGLSGDEQEFFTLDVRRIPTVVAGPDRVDCLYVQTYSRGHQT